MFYRSRLFQRFLQVWVLASCRQKTREVLIFLIHMKGRFMLLPFLPFCMLVICFIIFFISLNCFKSLFTCETEVPEPLAIRFLRLAFIKLGSCLSSFVIDWIIAST